ncbi:ESX-3 secretion system protein EccD [Mycobacterium tuberculosis variant africanum]|nr:ESX-3 secretion system protein EccD [Mycobacterium tuberculosis variant africanum]
MSGTVMQIVRVAILADSRLTEMALPRSCHCAKSCPRYNAWWFPRRKTAMVAKPTPALPCN